MERAIQPDCPRFDGLTGKRISRQQIVGLRLADERRLKRQAVIREWLYAKPESARMNSEVA
jgi:hypothetical protein